MYSSALQAIGQRAAVTIRKISVKADSTSDRAISLGVRWRMAPSTRAIMRSRNDLPALAVIRTTMRSDRTRVPPVTPERSPPASRMTGADSPVMADSSTEATPFDDLAVAGDDLAGLDHDEVARLAGRWRRFPRCSPSSSRRKAGVSRPGLAQGVGLGLAAGLGQRRGEVGEQHRQEQPDVQGDQVADRRLARRSRAARRP